MDFSPYDNFCCPFIKKYPATSEYEPRIAKFMAWVGSLPAKIDQPKRNTSASNAISLKDQPFMVKIVEEGYAFVFHGAFAPREGEGDTGGFDRIPYFTLITSDFEEIQFEGRAYDVAVCREHEKRFLLSLYLKAPRITDLEPKELGTAASAWKVVEKTCGSQENDSLPMTVTAPSMTGIAPNATGGEDEPVLDNIEDNPTPHGIRMTQEESPAWQSDNDTWTWL